VVLAHTRRARPSSASSCPASQISSGYTAASRQPTQSSCLTRELMWSAATGPRTGKAFHPASLTHRAACPGLHPPTQTDTPMSFAFSFLQS